jgi:hypothetical protein
MHDQTSAPGKPRHLTSVPNGTIPRPRQPAPEDPRPLGPSGRVRISLWHRKETEDARQLLYQLAEIDAADLGPARLGFTLGRLHGAALNLLDIIDAITEP